MGADSRAGAMVTELRRRSSEFDALWDTHIVSRRFEDHKILIHPEVGAIEVDCQALFTEDETQVLLVLTAAPRTDAAGKIELLNVLGTQELGLDPR